MIRPSSAGDIHRAILELAGSAKAFAAAIVLRDEGSTPREAGTKALIEADGSIRGTIGGGKVEAETQRLAVESIRTGAPSSLTSCWKAPARRTTSPSAAARCASSLILPPPGAPLTLKPSKASASAGAASCLPQCKSQPTR